jgi:hypothetical protein
MIYSFFDAIVIFSFPTIIRDKDISSSCSISIKALSVVSPAFIFNPARAVDRFFAVFSVSAKSFS